MVKAVQGQEKFATSRSCGFASFGRGAQSTTPGVNFKSGIFTVGFTKKTDIIALVHKKTYVVCTKAQRSRYDTTTRHFIFLCFTMAKLADFDTTISNSFFGQMSCLRHGNPLGASAPGTHKPVLHWSHAVSVFCWGLFKAVVLLWQIQVTREDTRSRNQCFFPVHMF